MAGRRWPAIELEAVVLKTLDHRQRQTDEYFVRLGRRRQSRTGYPGELARQGQRQCVGMAGMREPQVALEVGDKLRAQVAHLRPQVTGALAP